MKRIWNFLVLGLSMLAILAETNKTAAQSANTTNASVSGPLAGLAKMAMKLEDEDELPAKLCGLIWPDSGTHKYSIKKFSIPAEHEERLFCVRTDNQDVVIIHRTEATPAEDKKIRREVYYRTTCKGDLALALSAKFEYEIDDVDNELLKKMTYVTYGEVSGDGKKPHALDSDMRSQFDAEKKFWLKMQKKLGKKIHP